MYQVYYYWAPRDFGDLGRIAIYFHGAGEHWLLFSGIGRASLYIKFWGFRESCQNVKMKNLKKSISILLKFSLASRASRP